MTDVLWAILADCGSDACAPGSCAGVPGGALRFDQDPPRRTAGWDPLRSAASDGRHPWPDRTGREISDDREPCVERDRDDSLVGVDNSDLSDVGLFVERESTNESVVAVPILSCATTESNSLWDLVAVSDPWSLTSISAGPGWHLPQMSEQHSMHDHL